MFYPLYWTSSTSDNLGLRPLHQCSHAGAMGVATTTVYAPAAGPQVTSPVTHTQTPIYSTQAMPTSPQFFEFVTSPIINQSPREYNQRYPDLVPSVRASPSALQLQGDTVQTTRPTQLYLTQPRVFSEAQTHYRSQKFNHAQVVPSHLAGHEPCKRALTILESQIERQKQIEKKQSEHLRIMKEKSNEQKKKLDQLKVECRMKDLMIMNLKYRMDPKTSFERRKAEVPQLRAVINEQWDELEKLQHENSGVVTDKSTVISKRCGRRINKSQDRSVHRITDDASSRVMVDSHPNDLSKLQEENEAFRLEIERLERENSEISKLRVEVLQLGQRLREVMPLQKKTDYFIKSC
jgi:hypothetical protein